MKTAADPRLLSFVEAGRYLGGDTSPETVRTWTKARKGSAPLLRKVIIGRRSFVLREDVDSLIDAQLEPDHEPTR